MGDYQDLGFQPTATANPHADIGFQPQADARPSLASDALKYSPVGAVKSVADALRQVGTGHNPLAGQAAENEKLFEKAKDSFHQGDYAGAAAHFLNYLVPGGAGMEDAGEDFQKGDVAHGLAKTAGMATTLAAGVKAPEIMQGAGKVADKVAGAPAALSDAAKSAVRVDPAQVLVKALKPSSGNPDFVDSLPRAMGDIKAAEAHTGPIVDNESLITAAHKALGLNRDAMYPWEAVPSDMKMQVHGAPITNAMMDAAGEMLKLEDPASHAAIAQKAGAYDRPFTIDELKNLHEEGNKRLNGFYSAAPDKQSAMLGSGLNPAVEEAKVAAIRDLRYKALDPENEGAGPREIQQRYGDIADILNAAMKRRNTSIGSQPISPAAGLREEILANARIFKHGDVTPPNADALIKKAFENVEPGGAHPAPPDTPRVAGYLSAPAREMPATPDPSFVRGVPAMAEPPNPRE